MTVAIDRATEADVEVISEIFGEIEAYGVAPKNDKVFYRMEL
ncbi:hypothetical protein ACFPFX_05055 [Streptomyces mauvecolor]|uniref:GNAT family N-acetyltransferase n=1 Tax=Streptomyces mauvecolor TaxID=58345 RepID=A0ABV9UJN6_9ACTN